MRAAWYEQAQRRFQAWLETGGFHQPEPGSPDSVIAETAQQAGTTTELSRKVVVHGGPRSTIRPSAKPLTGVQSIPRNPGDERQK